jgi:hypothetical protein
MEKEINKLEVAQTKLHNLESTQINSNSRRALTKLNIIIALAAVMCATLFTSAYYESKLKIANNSEREARKLNKETFMALQGLITDNAEYLLKSSKFKIKRNDGITRGALFEKDWSHDEKDTFIKVAHTLGHTNCLNWVKSQPNWQVGLCKESQKMVIKGPERYKGKTAKDWREKYYTLKQHHYSDDHGSDYEAMKIATQKNKVSQSKLNALLAFIHDDVFYWNKVDVNDLNENWEIEYAKRIDEAPKMKAYLFQKEQSTTQTK